MATMQTDGKSDDNIASCATEPKTGGTTIELLKMAMPAEPRFVGFARRAVSSVTHQLHMDYNSTSDVLLAVGEACNNAVLYGNGRPTRSLTIICRLLKLTPRTDDTLEIDVRNGGGGFAEQLSEKSFTMPSADLMGESGRGLPLMRSLVDDVRITSEDGDTVVRLIKQLLPLAKPCPAPG